jgi:transcriptional regulator with XRE-family HTH domain
MSTLDIIRRNIREILGRSGSNPSALAKSIGMSNPLMYAYLSGKSDPGIEQLERIASGLGTTLAALIGEQVPRPADPAVERLRLEAIELLLKAPPVKVESVLIALKGAPAAGKKSKAPPA